MDGWTDGRTDGLMDVWMNGRTDGWNEMENFIYLQLFCQVKPALQAICSSGKPRTIISLLIYRYKQM